MISRFPTYAKGFILGVLIYIVVILAIRNYWSLRYLKMPQPITKTSEYLLIHNNHPRKNLWESYYLIKSDQRESAIDILEVSISRSGDINEYYLLGSAYKSQGEIKKALKIWEVSMDGRAMIFFAKQTSSVAKSRRAYRAAYQIDKELYAINIAQFFGRQGKHQKFEKVLIDAMSSYPNSIFWETWNYRLGIYYQTQNRDAEAVKIFELLLETASGETRKELLYRLGNVYSKLEDWERAKDVLESLRMESQDDLTVILSLGKLKYKTKQSKAGAISEFKKFILMSKKKARANYLVGKFYFEEREYSEAIRYLEIASEFRRIPPYKWQRKLAKSYQMENELESAFRVLKVANRMHPKLSVSVYYLALAYDDAGDQKTAIELADNHAEIISGLGKTKLYLRAGKLYEELGDKSKALEMYQDALKIKPNNKKAIQAVERLK